MVGLGAQHVVQSVIQWPQIGVNLVLQIAGQKAQALPGLHRRSGQNDPVHSPLPESGYGGGHSQVGFAGTGRTHTHGDGVLLDGLHILLLAYGLGLDGLALGRNTDHITGHLGNLVVISRLDQGDEVSDLLLIDDFSLGGQGHEALDGAGRLVRRLLLTGDFQIRAPVQDLDPKLLLNAMDILIQGAERKT